jgi:hypothetical protein
MENANSFGSAAVLRAGGADFRFYRLAALQEKGVADVSRLPFTTKIMLENLLRNEDGRKVTAEDINFVACGTAGQKEISFMPARVLLQDFTGVPAVVDLAAMRDALKVMGADAHKANPLLPADLVIDHSVQVDEFGTNTSFSVNALLEFQRNRERYALLRWGQTSFANFRVVPPDTGIVHQVNLEYLAPVVFRRKTSSGVYAYPDTVVGTDSHTTMINGLGVVGWGVGGIEAEACMLGQPISMLLPPVVGFKLFGALKEGCTATDLVLTITQILRKKGVVGKFVEFYGSGLSALSLADRATVSRGLRQGARPLPYGRSARSALLRFTWAKPRRSRSLHGRPEAPAGQSNSARCSRELPDRLRKPTRQKGRAPDRWFLGRHTKRSGRHRGHHQLHQYFESFRHDGRGAACEEGRRERAQIPTVGEDQSCPRFQGGLRLSH